MPFGVSLNRVESRSQLRLSRIVRVDHNVILELGLDRKAQAKTIIEAGVQLEAVGGRAAYDAPVDRHFRSPVPLIIMANGESGKKDVTVQIDIDHLISGGGRGKGQRASRNDFQQFGEIG